MTLVGLSAIIKFVEQFRSVGKGTYDIWQAVIFTGLTIPKDIETFFPMAALLGALIALGNLASRSELVIMQSAGFSRFKIGIAVMKTALPLVVFTMIIGEWEFHKQNNLHEICALRLFLVVQYFQLKNGVWAKDGHHFVFVRRVTDDTKLDDIYIYTFDQQHNLIKLKHANQASYSEDEAKWTLRQVNHSTIMKDEIITTNHLSETWETSLTPDKLGAVSLRPTSLSISGLYHYISFLRETGQDVSRFELTFWRKIFQPVSVGVMMLLALSFIFGSLRSVTAGARIVTGICVGFLFYVVNEILGQTSVVYGIPAILVH